MSVPSVPTVSGRAVLVSTLCRAYGLSVRMLVVVAHKPLDPTIELLTAGPVQRFQRVRT